MAALLKERLWESTLTENYLNDEGNGRATTTLEADGQHLSGKQAANKFTDNYEEVSNIPVTKQHQRREQRERKTHQTTNDCMDKKLTLNELQAALRQLKAKKSSDPDTITNEMLTHLGNKATCHSWATGTLPQTWREATIHSLYGYKACFINYLN